MLITNCFSDILLKFSFIPILLLVSIGMFSGQAFAVGTFNPPVVLVSDASPHYLYDADVDGTNIYLLYTVGTTVNDPLYFVSSNDSGATWNTPVLIEGTEHYTDAFHSGSAILVRDNGDVLVVYTTANVSNEFSVNSRLSTDGGVTFGAEVSQFYGAEGWQEMRIASDGDNILYTTTGGISYVGVVKSNDFGATWSSITKLSETPTYTSAMLPMGTVRGMNMYATWLANDALGSLEDHIFFSKSNDNGVTWDATVQISASQIDAGWDPRLEINESGGKIFVDYFDINGVNIYKSVSLDGGNTFNESVNEVLGSCNDFWSVAGDDNFVSFVCGKDTGATGGFFSKQSTDGGATFDALTVIDGTLGMNNQIYAIQDIDGDNVAFLFHDTNDINDPTVLSYSQDLGATWNTEIFLTNNGTSPETDYEYEVDNWITAMGGDIFIYFNAFTSGTIDFILGNIPNSGTTPPDTTAPVISTIFPEPITILENSVFDFTDHVVCLDDVDGDITILMDVTGTIDTTMRGTQSQTYVCEDSSLNGMQKTVDYIIKKKSTTYGGTGGSGVTSSIGGQQQNTVQSLSDVPILSFTPQPTTSATPQGQSLNDLFSSFVKGFQQQSQGSPSTGQATAPSVPASNPIGDFFSNFFANIFG